MLVESKRFLSQSQRFHYSQHKWYHICIGFLCLPGPGSGKRGVVTGSTRYLDIVHSEDLCCSWGTLSLWAPPLFFPRGMGNLCHAESMLCSPPGVESTLSAVEELSIFFFFFPYLLIFNWIIIALQCCVGFCHTSTWISHRYKDVPSPREPHFPALPSHSSRLPQSTSLSSLSHIANFYWLSILHIIMYMFSCYSVHPTLFFSALSTSMFSMSVSLLLTYR